MEYIAFDAHKRYTQVSVETEDGQRRYEGRIDHVRGALQQFLATCPRGSPVVVETVGTWDGIVDELEAAGQVPQLVHARKAKLMLGMVNKTDKLDARGLNRRHRAGTLPTVWIPPGPLRDQRDLPRTRRVLTRERTRLKHRIHATLAQDGLRLEGTSDLFGQRGRQWLRTTALPVLAPHRRDRDGAPPRAAGRRVGPGRGLRAASARGLCAHPGTAAPPDAPRGRVGAGCGPPPGDRRHPPLPARGAARRLCRHHASGARQRGPPPLRSVPGGHQSLPHVGLHRGGEYHLSHAPGPAAPARQSPLCARPTAEGARDGGRRGRAPLGGSPRLDPDQAGTGPANRRPARRRPRRDQRGVPMSARRSESDCDVRDTIMPR
jgi:hypothetical protein